MPNQCKTCQHAYSSGNSYFFDNPNHIFGSALGHNAERNISMYFYLRKES